MSEKEKFNMIYFGDFYWQPKKYSQVNDRSVLNEDLYLGLYIYRVSREKLFDGPSGKHV